MKKLFILLISICIYSMVVSCGVSISTPEKDAQEVVNVMKNDLAKGKELFYEKFNMYAEERGGAEAKEFAEQVTFKMEQLSR